MVPVPAAGEIQYRQLTPETQFGARESVRLAIATALQELPARQRAVLILRDVVQFSAAELAELLDTTPAAVNSALQRARTHLAEVAPSEDDIAEPDDADRRELLDRCCTAFENADLGALTELLQTDVRLEMPSMPVWFTGRDAVTRFLVLVQTTANGRPAVAEYRRAADGVLRAHSIHVLDTGRTGVAVLTVFLDPGLFSAFGLPPTR